MPRNILVPLDGSAFSERALPVALGIARASKAVLHIVRIHVPPTRPPLSLEGMPYTDPDQDAVRWEAERAYVTRIRVGVGPRSELATRIAVLNGPVADVLAIYASVNVVDLIVMSTHGRGGLARVWQGSVADELIRCSRVPVLLVRPSGDAAKIALTEGPPRILIPLDGSGLAEEMVEAAVEVGRSLDAEYTLLRVVNPFGTTEDLSSVLGPALGRTMAEPQAAEALTYLTEIAWWMRERGLRVETSVIVSDRPAQVILSEAARQGAALVAMATHGRSGLPRLVMGSVAGQVLRDTRLPLLVYRPKMDRPRRRQGKPAALREPLVSASL